MNNLSEVLQACLSSIKPGDDIEACLASYPEFADQIRPYLEKALEVQRVADPPENEDKIPFDWVLEECVKAVGNGENAEDCYKRYPYYAQQLKPWLNAVLDLRERNSLLAELDQFSVSTEAVPDVPFSQALQEYLNALDAGANPESIIRRYPYFATRMRFWAEYVSGLKAKIPPSVVPAFIRAQRKVPFTLTSLTAIPLRLIVSLSMAFVLVLSSGIGYARAAASLPGDTLYPIKLTIEQIQLATTPLELQAQLLSEIAERRREETQVLLEQNMQQEVAFEGQVDQVLANSVVVSDIEVVFASVDQKIKSIIPGTKVKIKGYTSGNVVVVTSVEVLPTPIVVVGAIFTNTPIIPTATRYITPTVFVTNTLPPTIVFTVAPTHTLPPPNPTDTSVPPTFTATAVPPTATETATSIPPSPTSTATAVPPTSTPTDTPTETPVPPSPTNTATPVPPTETPTPEPLPTSTDTPFPAPTSWPTPEIAPENIVP